MFLKRIFKKGGEIMCNKKGFTLIELLIVVAIIAILAAIAVPNFLEAQTRSKVARTQADMRTLATGLEAYAVDNKHYPIIVAPNSPYAGDTSGTGSGINGLSPLGTGRPGVSSRFIWLTTPIAYITSIFRDPFQAYDIAKGAGTTPDLIHYDSYDYVDAASLWTGGIFPADLRGSGATSGADWRLAGCGPDHVQATGGGPVNYGTAYNDLGCDYDSTNGTVSAGDIVRIGGGAAPNGGGTYIPAWDRIQNKKNY